MPPNPVPQSLLSWMVSSLGFTYVVLLPLAGGVCLVLALLLVLRGKGPLTAAALVMIVPVPLLIGLFAAIQGMTSAFTVIATSGATPKPAEIAEGISVSLAAPLIGMLMMIPAFLAALIGAVVRSLSHTKPPGK